MEAALHQSKTCGPGQFIFSGKSPIDPKNRTFCVSLYLKSHQLLVFGQFCKVKQNKPVMLVTFKFPDLSLRGGLFEINYSTLLENPLEALDIPNVIKQFRASLRTRNSSGAFRRSVLISPSSSFRPETVTSSISGARRH